jgi:hypothetical protein
MKYNEKSALTTAKHSDIRALKNKTPTITAGELITLLSLKTT